MTLLQGLPARSRAMGRFIRVIWKPPLDTADITPKIPAGSEITFELIPSSCGLSEDRTRRALELAFGSWICAGAPVRFRLGQPSAAFHVDVKWTKLGGDLALMDPPSNGISGLLQLNCCVDWARDSVFEDVIVHEIGNLWIEDDCDFPESVMCDSGDFPHGARRCITAEDIVALSEVYRAAWTPGSCKSRPGYVCVVVWGFLKAINALGALRRMKIS